MTPKEKAKELVNKFQSQIFYHVTDERIDIEESKGCALIAVDLHLEELSKMKLIFSDRELHYKFWQDVKQEIENSNCSISIDGTLKNILTGKIKKWTKDTNGYMRATIYYKGIAKTVSQHRILAEYFIENTECKLQVNHKNGIKDDNRIENLEWVTQSENTLHSFANGLQKVTKPNMMSVIDKVSGNLYESISEASRQTGWSVSHLRNMLLNNITNKTNLELYGK
jgi:hypothetical protein